MNSKICISIAVDDDGRKTKEIIHNLHKNCYSLWVEDCYNILLCGNEDDMSLAYEEIFNEFYNEGLCHRFILRINLNDNNKRLHELLHEPLPKASKYYIVDWDKRKYTEGLPEILRLSELHIL
jgi:hypothetical protein